MATVWREDFVRGLKEHVNGSTSVETRRRRRRFGRAVRVVAPLTVLVSVLTATAASATSVTAVTAAATPATPGVAASYPISFTPPASQGMGSTISVEAAPGTTFSACSSPSTCANDYQLVQGAGQQPIGSVAVQAGPASATPNEFTITLATANILAGNPVTIEATGENPPTAGTDTLSIWTSTATSPVSVDYTIGTDPGSLTQGTLPNGGLQGLGSSVGPAYLQNIFGTATGTTPTLGEYYLPRTTWQSIDGSGESLAGLTAFAVPGYQVELGVPMLPDVGANTLAAGANHAYDSYWETLADTLCSYSLGNAWLRLGYEFDNALNATYYTGNDISELTSYGQYFANIVAAMKFEEAKDVANGGCPGAANGPGFRFAWNPSGLAFLGANDPDFPRKGGMPVSALAAAWPGGYGNSQFVNSIGVDVYDAEPPNQNYTPAQNWVDNISKQLTGAQQFEAAVGVSGIPLSFPDWGLMAPMQTGEMGGMGDDPTFIDGMYCFMAENGVSLESYNNVSEIGWNSQLTGGSFPDSLQAFQTAFGQNAYNCSDFNP